jgi:hypothetical protein
MSGSSTKKSLSRQLEEESRRVKEGKSPEKRTIRNNTLVEAEVAPLKLVLPLQMLMRTGMKRSRSRRVHTEGEERASELCPRIETLFQAQKWTK